MTRVINGIYITDLLGPGDEAIESYHLADLLEYKQKSSIRKQVLTDWKKVFQADVDYVLVHDEKQLKVYETGFRGHLRKDLTPPQSPERGRIFLRPSGVRKIFDRTSKDTTDLESSLESFFQVTQRVAAPMPAPAPVRAPDAHPEPKTEELSYMARKRGYEILETLLDHLKNLTDPGLKRLAIMSAELGLGRELPDLRRMVDEEVQLEKKFSRADEQQTPDLGDVVKPNDEVVELKGRDEVARAYLAKRPFSSGPLLPDSSIYYGLKQIGDKAGGYTAVQAGKAADIVAARFGYGHEDIRTKKLPFNELPELPDNTSGKLRKMYRFNSRFANHVIVELRTNEAFEPGKPVDLRPFGQGGDELPKLSRGPLEEA